MKNKEDLQKRVEESQLLAELVNQPGWEIVEHFYEEKIKELDTIRGVNAGNFKEEVAGRRMAIRQLEDWMAEIESRVNSIDDLKNELEIQNKESELYKVHP
jgi:hypothetical protein